MKNRRLMLLVALVLVMALQIGCLAARPVRNLILLIGDGMGFAQITAARIVKGSNLYMDGFVYTGNISTYPDDPKEKWVTDSAAAGTSLATGVKTYNDAISVDVRKEPVKTVLEHAQELGKATGLVSTTRLTHATPACFAAHNPVRDNETEIAVDILNHNVDVLLAGGRQMFLPVNAGGKRTDGLDLIAKAKSQGYTYVENRDALNAVTGGKVLGLFKNSHLSFDIDRDPAKEPGLPEMARKAIELLSSDPDGFFLMIEGGRIDQGAHGHDAATMVRETLAFDEAIGVALDFALRNSDTLVIVTADHQTGGLSVGGYGVYMFKPEVLRLAKKSFEEFIGPRFTETNIAELMAEYAGITDLTEAEIDSVRQALELKEKTPNAPALAAAEIVSRRAFVGWTSSTHTGVDVPLFAFGAGAEDFTGHLDNTDVNKRIVRAILQ